MRGPIRTFLHLDLLSPSKERSKLEPLRTPEPKRSIKKYKRRSDSKNGEREQKSSDDMLNGQSEDNKISGNCGVMFRIIKYLRKWGFFHSYKNLKEYHLKIVNDQTTYFEEDEEIESENKNDKQFKSIWSTQKAKVKRRRHSNYLLHSAITYLKRRMKYLMESGGLVSKVIFYLRKCFKRLKVFDQNHILKVIWDMLIILLILIELFVYSIERSFSVELMKSHPFHDLFLTIIVVFYMDTLVTLNTNFYFAGIQIKTRGLIIVNYFKRLFLLDMLGCFGAVFYFLSTDAQYRDFNLLLLLKLLTKQDISKKLKHIIVRNDKFEAIFDLLTLGLKILISGHIIACLWHYISYRESSLHLQENSWLIDKGLLMKGWQVKYLYSFYWSVTTMLTVGYGDITPKNEVEMLFNVWAMFFGCVIFGYSLNSIGEILKRSGKYTRLLKEKTDRLNVMIRGMGLTSDLEHKVRKYLEFVWHQEKLNDPEAHNIFLSQLSSNLRDEIFLQTNVKYLRNISVFNRIFSDETLLKIAKSMKKVRFSPEEFVYKSGQNDDSSLYIITEGTAVSLTEKDHLKKATPICWDTLKRNDYFGIFEFFTELERRESIYTKEFTTVFQVNRNDLFMIIRRSPREYEKFCKIKDSLMLYGNPISLDIKCSSCGRVDHRVFDCNFLNYNIDAAKIAYKLQVKGKKMRKRFRRKRGKKINALKKIEEFATFARDFLLDYEDDQTVKEIVGRCAAENEIQEPPEMTIMTQKFLHVGNEASPKFDAGSSSYGKDDGFPSSSSESFKDKIKTSIAPRRRESKMKTFFEKITIEKSSLERQDSFKTKFNPKLGEIIIEALPEDTKVDFLPTDKIRNFEFYFPHNNAQKIIDKINKKILILLKKKENAQINLAVCQSPRKSKRVWLDSKMKSKKF